MKVFAVLAAAVVWTSGVNGQETPSTSVVAGSAPSSSPVRSAVDSLPANVSEMPDSQPVLPCTLEITTNPAGAAISVDGNKVGVSPIQIPGIAPGKHSVVIQKTGFYQKKAVVEITTPGKTVLSFQLSAPGKLSISSEPPGASIVINGVDRGKTPFSDSLMKPGVYRFSLSKEHCTVVSDSVTVTSGAAIVYNGKLELTAAYRDSVSQAAAKERSRKRRFSIGVVGGAFVLFLVMIAAIELKE